MKTLKNRLAVAAALAALSLPVVAAAEQVGSVTGDPTFPSLDNPAPAMVLRGDGSRSSLSDPTFPEVATVAPAARLTPYVSDAPAVDPVENVPVAHVAVVPEAAPQQASAQHVAVSR